jgi:hypothetical protein
MTVAKARPLAIWMVFHPDLKSFTESLASVKAGSEIRGKRKVFED